MSKLSCPENRSLYACGDSTRLSPSNAVQPTGILVSSRTRSVILVAYVGNPEYQHQHTLNSRHALRLLYAVRYIVLGWPHEGSQPRRWVRNIDNDMHITIRHGRRAHAPAHSVLSSYLARCCLYAIRARQGVRRYARGDFQIASPSTSLRASVFLPKDWYQRWAWYYRAGPVLIWEQYYDALVRNGGKNYPALPARRSQCLGIQ